jgi:glyoxylase-like metal-dependent hydrolase (beta-lactamase superfamily II)
VEPGRIASMFHISRRQFVVSASAAAAAFGLDKPVAFITPARAQNAAGPNALLEKGFVTFKVGDIEVTQLYDGIWEKAHDPGFIRQVTVEETKAALRAAGLPDAHVPIPFTVTVIRTHGKTVMFDSGTGAQLAPTAGLITKKDLFKVAGIDPTNVSAIIVTHFHPDHIFGLMAKDTNAQIFPKAEIIVPAAEYKWWTDPGLIAKLPEARQGLAKRIQATFPGWKNIKQLEGDKEVVPGVRPVASYGHTPGHTSYLVSSGNQQLMVLGDVTNIPALFVKNPGWHAAFDQDALMAEASRRKMFDRCVAEQLMVAGYHYGMPGAGTIVKDGGGYAFVPIKA